MVAKLGPIDISGAFCEVEKSRRFGALRSGALLIAAAVSGGDATLSAVEKITTRNLKEISEMPESIVAMAESIAHRLAKELLEDG